jgi:hypothetical protein
MIYPPATKHGRLRRDPIHLPLSLIVSPAKKSNPSNGKHCWVGWLYSPLMFAALMIGHHFSISVFW